MAKYNVPDEYQHMNVDDLQKLYIENSIPAKICLLNLTGDMNIGMIIRTSACFAFSEVIIVGRRKFDSRTAVGTSHYIPIRYVRATTGHHSEELDNNQILELLSELSQTHQIVFIEQSDMSIDLQTMNEFLDKKLPPVFVFGTEATGIPKEVLDFEPSICVQIPQSSSIGRSLNVAIAHSMVVWEYSR